MDTPIPVIVGPTASGKSAVAEALAARLDADILSCDSRQVFRGMTIGTASPGPDVLARIPHHFIAERDPSEPWSAGIFKREAESRIHELRSSGRPVIVVGGSTLYVSALVNGLGNTPTVPPEVRSALNAELELQGAEVLYAMLLRVDPDYAATLDATKTQRIIRGLEVYRATGKPLSSYQADHEPPAFAYRLVVINRERPLLYAAINERVDRMMDDGLLDEVRALHDAGFTERDPAMRTIGYQELFPVLRGEATLDDAIRAIKTASRRYAKRQCTWLRRFPEAEWVDMDQWTLEDLVHHLAGSTTISN